MTCKPYCAMFDGPIAQDDGIAVCGDCGALYELRETTRWYCETIDGEPVPETWRRGEKVMAWYTRPGPWTYPPA